jgi:hypothetical protein
MTVKDIAKGISECLDFQPGNYQVFSDFQPRKSYNLPYNANIETAFSEVNRSLKVGFSQLQKEIEPKKAR